MNRLEKTLLIVAVVLLTGSIWLRAGHLADGAAAAVLLGFVAGTGSVALYNRRAH